MPVVNLGNTHRTAQSEPEAVVAYRGLLAGRALAGYRIAIGVKKTARIQRIVGEVLVRTSMHVVGAGLGGVLDESAAGMAVLSRVGRGDDLHFLDALGRRRALMALLVTHGVTKGGAIEKILRSHGLAAVDARIELAATKHRVAIRLHGEIARLDLQHGLGETNIRCGDYRDITIILFVHGVTDVRCGHLELLSTRLDLYRLRDRAHRQNDILADGFCPLEQDPRIHRRLESGVVDGHRVTAQHQRRSGVGSGVIADQSRLDAGPLVADLDRRARNAGTGWVGHDSANDPSVRSLCQKQTAQAKNTKDNT